MKMFITTALLALFATASAFASDEIKLPQNEDKLESQGQLALRATSPDSDFGTKGEKIGWVKQGELVQVVSLKQVSTVFGFEVWVEVKTSEGAKGWVYDGMASEVLKGRSNLVEKEQLVMAKAD